VGQGKEKFEGAVAFEVKIGTKGKIRCPTVEGVLLQLEELTTLYPDHPKAEAFSK
jgi:hypothetical protein